MSYKVGQILSNNISTYFTNTQKDILNYISDIETKNDIIEVYFKDKKIAYTFRVDSNYYIKLKIKRFTNSDQKITLRLINDTESSSDVFQYVDNFVIFQNSNEDENEYATIEAVVSPNTTYTHLAIILTRQYEDFVIEQASESSVVVNNRLGRQIEITGYEISEFVNLIPVLDSGQLTFTKLGIQGPPGMLMCINGEGIRIGPSRIYEIRNGYKVTFLGIVRGQSKTISGDFGRDSFIIDYQYNDTITLENQEEGE